MAHALLSQGSLLSPRRHHHPFVCESPWTAAAGRTSRPPSLVLSTTPPPPRLGHLRSSSGGFLRVDMVVLLREDKGKPANCAPAQMRLRVWEAMKWWEKGVQTNMKEIRSAHDLVNSLLNAGNKLVVVDFFSPGCGGCRALHPKICQIAEMNPDVQFFQIDYEEHKSMCWSLNVHILPFFRFYRGAQGRVCSFSCTNATINKFRDALARHGVGKFSHGAGKCGHGPAKGLEEAELMALSANRDLCFTYTKRAAEQLRAPSTEVPEPAAALLAKLPLSV